MSIIDLAISYIFGHLMLLSWCRLTPRLASVSRFQSSRGDMAETDVDCFKAIPTPAKGLNALSVPGTYEAFSAWLDQPNAKLPSCTCSGHWKLLIWCDSGGIAVNEQPERSKRDDVAQNRSGTVPGALNTR